MLPFIGLGKEDVAVQLLQVLLVRTHLEREERGMAAYMWVLHISPLTESLIAVSADILVTSF